VEVKNMNQGIICWNCGKEGSPYVGSKRICYECDVIWFPIVTNTARLNTKVVHGGEVLEVIDFSEPDAPSCP